MTPVAPDVASAQDVPTADARIRRDRVVVRRRRSRDRRHHLKDWTARRSYRKVVRAVVVCVAVLAVMALGLYFGLARQDIGPTEGSRLPPGVPPPTVPA